jgi:hypothetical protein
MRKTLLVGFAGAAACTAVARAWEPRLALHEDDWSCYGNGSSRRAYRSLSHFLFHLRELLSIQERAAEIYLRRAISPAFRERIMLVTAMANDCSI